MKMQSWAIEKVKPYPGNSKKHFDERIKSSIAQFGFDQPIVVGEDGVIIKGHGRYEAAKSLGIKTIPVIVRTDLTPEQVRISRIADNRSHEGGWDFAALKRDLKEINLEKLDLDLSALGIVKDWYDKQEFIKEDSRQEIFTDQKAFGKKDPAELKTLVVVLSGESIPAWEAFKRENKTTDESVAFRKLLLGK